MSVLKSSPPYHQFYLFCVILKIREYNVKGHERSFLSQKDLPPET